jgi:hypothetical protein
VQTYGKLVAPLTNLLKKNAFSWNAGTNQSFQAFKEAMCMTLVLVLPNFKKNFVLECDSYRKGIGFFQLESVLVESESVCQSV